jgi:hypothetical protein
MIIMITITIRPGPNMDANPAFLLSYSPRFRRRNLLCADQPNWLEVSPESFFVVFISVFRVTF